MTDPQLLARRIFKALGTFLVLALAATLIRVWPRESVPPSGIYPGESIQMRSYLIPWRVIDDSNNVLVTRLKELQWRLANPGLVRIQSAARKVDERHPSFPPKEFAQMIFQELGYAFPKGCYAVCGSPGMSSDYIIIYHYPSMLNIMEKRLGLRSYRLKPLQPNRSAETVATRQQRLSYASTVLTFLRFRASLIH